MNPFARYHEHHTQYLKIKHHDTNSINIIDSIIKKSLELDQQDCLLDLIHLILKHARHCSVSHCAAQLKQNDLFNLILSKVAQKGSISCSLLICLNDLLKAGPLQGNIVDSWVPLVTRLWWDKRVYMCRKSMELCNRMIPLISQSHTMVDSLSHYLGDLSQCLTRQTIAQFNQTDYTEFFYQQIHEQLTLDREIVRWTTQMVISLFLNHPKQFTPSLDKLASTIQDLYDDYITDAQEPIEFLFDICCANDDDTIRLLDAVLTMYQEQMYCVHMLEQINMHPHSLFLFFLYRCGRTHDILIDLLLDSSSDFLAYFHRYILFACQHINQLHASFDDSIIDLDTFQTIIANTLRVLDGGGFPYNTKPLIKRLLQLEEQLYFE